jgi:hypothetical protein
LQGYGHVFGGGVLRALPETSPIFGLGAGARLGAWDAEVSVCRSLSATAHANAPAGAGADISLSSLQVIVCFSPVLSRTTALGVCAGALYERLSGESHGVSNPASGSVQLLSPAVGLRSRIRVLPRLYLGLDVVGTARPRRPRFVIGGVGQVHEMPVFDGMLQAGVLVGL